MHKQCNSAACLLHHSSDVVCMVHRVSRTTGPNLAIATELQCSRQRWLALCWAAKTLPNQPHHHTTSFKHNATARQSV